MVEHRERARQVGRGVARSVAGLRRASARPGARRARTGRIWSRTIGAASLAKGCTAPLARLSAFSAGCRCTAAGRRVLANLCDRAERVGRLAQRPGQVADRARDVGLLGGEGAEDGRGGVDQRGEVVALAGELVVEVAQRVHQPARFWWRCGDQAVDAGQVAVRGLEAAEDLAQVVAAALQASPGAVDQQREVVARVGVQRGEDLVGVDVGQRVGDRQGPPALGQRRADRLPGSSSMNMSLSPVLGRSRACASVWTRSLYCGSRSSVTTAWPSFRPTLVMSPTRTPETRTVWPWPGVTACAVENAACSWNGLALPREAQALVVQDVAAHERGDERRARRPRRSARRACGSRASLATAPSRVAGTSETFRSEPSALRSLRSQSTVFCSACALAAADGSARSKPWGAASGTRAQVGRLLGLAGHVGAQRRARVVLGRGRVDALQRLAGEEELVGAHRVGELRRGEHARGTTGRWRRPSGSRRRGRAAAWSPPRRPGRAPGTSCPRSCPWSRAGSRSFWQLEACETWS